MINCRLIKEGVEVLSGIKDISIKNRTGYIMECRLVYYKLCSMFTDATLEKIGSVLGGRTHATVISGIKRFDGLYATGDLKTDDIFQLLLLSYSKGEQAENIKDIQTIEGVKKYYRIKFLSHIEKSHSIINKYRRRILKIEKHPFMSKVLDLNEFELNELEYKFDVFFKVKEKLREKHTINSK